MEVYEIFVIDSSFSPKIAILIKTINKSDFNLCFGNCFNQNSYGDTSSELTIINAALQNNKISSGSILHSDYWVVPRDKERYLMFIFSQIHGDSLLNSSYSKVRSHYSKLSGQNWSYGFIESSSFTYKSRVTEQSRLEASKEFDELAFVDSSWTVENLTDSIKFLNKLSSFEAGQLVISLDSLGK
jgi:hypothetical protein